MEVHSKSTNRKILKLLLIIDQQSGGEWVATKAILEQLHNRHSVAIDLIAWKQNSHPTNFFFTSVTLLDKPNPNPPFSFLRRLFFQRSKLIQALYDYLNLRSKPDIVLTTDYFVAVALGRTLKKLSIPLLFSFHGVKSQFRLTLFTINYREIITKFLERLALLKAPTIIVPAKNGYRIIKQQLGFFLPDQKVHSIPNLIDQHFYKNVTHIEIDQFMQKYQIPHQSRIILYCGRLVSYKGIERLLTAYSAIAKRHKKSVLVLAFPSESVEPGIKRSIETAQQNGYQDRIVLLSNLSVEELNILYRISWTSVLASETEISPLVMYESLTCGTPVIGTRVGNMPEVLEKINKRLIVSKQTSQHLTQTIDWILSLSQKEYKKLRISCSQFPIANTQRSLQILWSLILKVTK